MFQGSIVALVTPMTSNGALDEKKLNSLIDRHLELGTDGLVVNGTTGEAPTLSEAERKKLIEITIKKAKGKIPVLVGTGTYNTSETIYQTKEAENLGADGAVVVTPYYNKPTQEGLYQHYKEIAKAVSFPILLYNVPHRTGCDLLPETVARLSEISNIIGLKEASEQLNRVPILKKSCKKEFILLSGDDASALAFMLQGGNGVISVTANVVPKLMHEMCQAALEGNIQRAGTINTKLMSLHKKLFVESNPIPVKWAVHQLGWIDVGIRLPLTQLSEQHHNDVREAMKESGVVN